MNLPKRKTTVLLLTLLLIISSLVVFVSAQSTIVSPPTFSPEGGTYTSAQTVAISSATSNAVIRYTLDGSEPTDTSPLYYGPISVGATTTIKAKASVSLVDGFYRSDTASATYTINAPTEKVATPTFSPSGGSYSGAQTVTIQSATSGATITYTTSGEEPASSSTVYTEPFPVNTNTTIKAKAFATGMTDSDTATATYTIVEETVTQPPSDNTLIYAAIAAVVIIAVVVGAIVALRARKKSSV